MPAVGHDEELIRKVVERCLQQQRQQRGPADGGRRNAGRGGPAVVGAVGMRREGDWACRCGYSNFSYRLACRQCSAPRQSGPRPGNRGAAAGAQKSPAPAGAAAGGGRGAARGGGVSEGRSFASVVRQPAPAQKEFTRQQGKGELHVQGNKGNEARTSGGGTGAPRPTWYDLTRGDADTAVGADQRRGATAAEDEDLEDDEADQRAGAEEQDVDVAELQRKVAQDKGMLKTLQKQGRGPGDGAYDGVQANLDSLVARLEAAKPKDAAPTGRSLQRAQALLDKAVAARGRLSDELQEAEAEFHRKLDQYKAKFVEVDARIDLHTAKVANIKAAIGGDVAPKQVRRAKQVVGEASTRFNNIAPKFHDLMARIGQCPQFDEAIRNDATSLHDELRDFQDALKFTGEVLGDELDADVDELGFTIDHDDSDYEDDSDDEDGTFGDGDMADDSPEHGDADGGMAQAGGANSGPSNVDALPTPAAGAGAAGGSQGTSGSESAQLGGAAPQSAPGESTEAASGGDDASLGGERPAKQAKLVSGDAKVDAVAAAAKVAAAAVGRKAGASGSGGSLRAVRTTGKVKTGRAAPGAGGATAPTPVAMDTSGDAQDDAGDATHGTSGQ